MSKKNTARLEYAIKVYLTNGIEGEHPRPFNDAFKAMCAAYCDMSGRDAEEEIVEHPPLFVEREGDVAAQIVIAHEHGVTIVHCTQDEPFKEIIEDLISQD